ncbi:MAG TPA: hypothetical protein VK023_06050, partial [Sphingobacterium bovisgrunnientis]|nr:hypothetical protein [Sphingobacterium bovisgrunnientis]
MLKTSFIVFVFLNALVLQGQTLLPKSKYNASSSLVLNGSVNVNWTKSAAYYLWDEGDGKVIYKIDLKSNRKTLLTSESTIKSALLNGNFASKDILDKWNLYSYEVDENRELLSFRFNGKNYDYALRDKVLKQVEPEKSAVKNSYRPNSADYWKKFNSDSTKYIFGKGHNVYLFDIKSNIEYKLSSDGEPYFSYNNNNAAENDTIKPVSTSAVWIGNNIISWREDKRQIGEMAVINSLSNPHPTI